MEIKKIMKVGIVFGLLGAFWQIFYFLGNLMDLRMFILGAFIITGVFPALAIARVKNAEITLKHGIAAGFVAWSISFLGVILYGSLIGSPRAVPQVMELLFMFIVFPGGGISLFYSLIGACLPVIIKEIYREKIKKILGIGVVFGFLGTFWHALFYDELMFLFGAFIITGVLPALVAVRLKNVEISLKHGMTAGFVAWSISFLGVLLYSLLISSVNLPYFSLFLKEVLSLFFSLMGAFLTVIIYRSLKSD